MIRLDNVTRRYRDGTRPALDGVTLDIDRGEFVFVTGPSGAGKSTLLRLLYAAERPDSGDVLIEGKSVVRLQAGSVPFLRRNLGIIFQDFKLLPRRSIFDNVALALEVCGQPRSVIEHKVLRILGRVGLGGLEGRRPGELSAGEQQRAAIARALVNEPSVVLADEPTGNLDEALSNEIVDLLAELAREKQAAVIVATHDAMQVALRGFRRVRLEEGRIVADVPARGELPREIDEEETIEGEWDLGTAGLRGAEGPTVGGAVTQPSGVGLRAVSEEDLAAHAASEAPAASDVPESPALEGPALEGPESEQPASEGPEPTEERA